MSSSDRRLFLGLAAAFALAACGFTPVNAPGGAGGALSGTIVADAPADNLGYDFVARIEGRLGRPDAPRWALAYTLATRDQSVGITPENVATRVNITGTLTWSLRPVGAEDPVLSGQLQSFTAYSTTGTTVATLTARRDAERRLAVILADMLVTRLYASADALVP